MASHATPSRKRSSQSIRWPQTCPELVLQLNGLFQRAVDGPFTFDQLRTLDSLRILVRQLKRCPDTFLVFSLLWCKLDFAAKAGDDETSVDCARGYACEIAAMRLLRTYNSQEVLSALTNDYKATEDQEQTDDAGEQRHHEFSYDTADDQTPLLRIDTNDSSHPERTLPHYSTSTDLESSRKDRIGGDSFTALEVAIMSHAKHFISAHICQDILTEIWHGDIIFWNDISTYESKKASFYDKNLEPKFWNFARLRVPQYAFVIESFNFLALAVLYMTVIVNREYRDLGWVEVLLALWFLGFTYQEYDQFREAGTMSFYLANPFNYFDLGMIIVAFAWILLRIIGIAEGNPEIVGRSYDVLALQGVMLVPRLFSFLSLSPYFGTLFPCLRRLASDFMKFLILIIALYAGFLVTFSVLGRNSYSISEIAWLLIRVFFGGSGMGFDAMHNLHPVLGAPLMIIFVTFTQILLTTALISILSNSVSFVMNNARSEYHFMFATTCLEATKSDHLISLSPPFNLLALVLVRPLRLFLPSNHVVLRRVKICILKVTHAPYVLLFSLYERSPLAPIGSESHQRKLNKEASHSQGPIVRPVGGLHRLGSALLGSAGVIDTADHSQSAEDVEEEGIDTGIMIPESAGGGLDEETRSRMERMERQMEEMKGMMETLLAGRDR